jgi:hypothetical protein
VKDSAIFDFFCGFLPASAPTTHFKQNLFQLAEHVRTAAEVRT